MIERVSVTELDGENVFGNEVGIGEGETEGVVVVESAGEFVIL